MSKPYSLASTQELLNWLANPRSSEDARAIREELERRESERPSVRRDRKTQVFPFFDETLRTTHG
jgi:hypothetical protein